MASKMSVGDMPVPREEDAFNFLVGMLPNEAGDYGYAVYLPFVMHSYLERVLEIQQNHQSYFPKLSPQSGAPSTAD